MAHRIGFALLVALRSSTLVVGGAIDDDEGCSAAGPDCAASAATAGPSAIQVKGAVQRVTRRTTSCQEWANDVGSAKNAECEENGGGHPSCAFFYNVERKEQLHFRCRDMSPTSLHRGVGNGDPHPCDRWMLQNPQWLICPSGQLTNDEDEDVAALNAERCCLPLANRVRVDLRIKNIRYDDIGAAGLDELSAQMKEAILAKGEVGNFAVDMQLSKSDSKHVRVVALVDVPQDGATVFPYACPYDSVFTCQGDLQTPEEVKANLDYGNWNHGTGFLKLKNIIADIAKGIPAVHAAKLRMKTIKVVDDSVSVVAA